MNNSLKLFSVQGIDIRLHYTFPLILAWAAYQFGSSTGSMMGALFGVIAISLLFVLVTLHELGHSFAALRYDVPVKQIVLTPVGGVAQLSRMPEKPVQELVIAAAGPAVNIVIALLMGLFLLIPGFDLMNLGVALTGVGGITVASLFTFVFVYNLFLAAFNLLPAFPMDGGRILRALLAMRLEYARATNIAANIGRVLAVAMGIYGLINFNVFQILIAVFIFGSATQEARYTRIRHALIGYKVQDVFSTEGYRLEPNYTLQQAANLTLYSGQRNFAVVLGERLVGFLSNARLQGALRSSPSYEYVTAVMQRDLQPVTPNLDLLNVQQRMVEENLEALPVVTDEDEFGNGRYLGMITREQIIRLQFLLNKAPQVAPAPKSA